MLPKNQKVSFQGVVLRGAFHVDAQEAATILQRQGNLNGKTNSDVMRPIANGKDLTRRGAGRQVIDFGVWMPLEEAALYEAPFEHVESHVYPERQKAKQQSAREKWWIHWNPRPEM